MKSKSSVVSVIGTILVIVIPIACFLGMLAFVAYALAPLAPLITVTFVFLVSLFAITTKRGRIEAALGLTVYVFSWPAIQWWGTAASLTCTLAGMLLFFNAGLRGLIQKLGRHPSFH